MFLSDKTMRLLMELDAPAEQKAALLHSMLRDEEAAALPTKPCVSAPSPPAPLERVWVYVMAVDHPDDTLVKVGISKHPNYRRETLEKERGLNLYVAHTEGPYSRALAMTIERAAHEMLADHRERGEWFLCGLARATEVVRDCAFGARP